MRKVNLQFLKYLSFTNLPSCIVFSDEEWIDNLPNHEDKKIDGYEQSQHSKQLEVTDYLKEKWRHVQSIMKRVIWLVIKCKLRNQFYKKQKKIVEQFSHLSTIHSLLLAETPTLIMGFPVFKYCNEMPSKCKRTVNTKLPAQSHEQQFWILCSEILITVRIFRKTSTRCGIQVSDPHLIFTWVSKKFKFAVGLVLGTKKPRHFLSQSKYKSKPIVTYFPALYAGYVHLLRVLIGSLHCLCSWWLSRVFSFGIATLKSKIALICYQPLINSINVCRRYKGLKRSCTVQIFLQFVSHFSVKNVEA